MELPKFILGDNSDFPETLYIIHTDFPRFILNVETDEVEWLEEFDKEDMEDLEAESEQLFAAAFEFYEHEISQYEE